jgi:microtubule-associated protein-like 6
VSDGTVLTSGKDCLIKAWDFTLQEVGSTIDITEDVGQAKVAPVNGVVVSLQQWGKTILVGTKGCEIYEIELPSTSAQPYTLTRLMSGHSSGELWGLSMHPTKEEFCTCGDDKTLRVWSIRTHEQLAIRYLPLKARSVAYNHLGGIICVGMVDGSIALIDAKSTALKVYSTWRHSNRIITDIKFSPNGQLFAAASGDSNIYIYKSEDQVAFKRQAVCKGHDAPVTHIDFSANSQHIQSNAVDGALLFWDLKVALFVYYSTS